MANEVKVLPCGCRPGFSHCPESQALWAEVNAKYGAVKGTEEWQAYDEALAAYRQHFKKDESGDDSASPR